MAVKTFGNYKTLMTGVLREIGGISPGLKAKGILHGSMPISICHTEHCVSIDIDITSKKVHGNLLPELGELKKSFGKSMDVYEVDRDFGMGRAQIKKQGVIIGLDVFSAFEPMNPEFVEASPIFKGFDQISLEGYIESKLQILSERHQAKDLWHLCALSKICPSITNSVNKAITASDLALLKADMLSKEFGETIRLATLPGTKAPTISELKKWVNNLAPIQTLELE